MTPSLIVECAALILLFVCSAFFSSAETALFSLNPIQIHRVRRSRPTAAASIEHMLAVPANLLSTILIGNTLANVAAAALAYVIAERFYPAHGVAVSIPIMTMLLLIFGEVAPKRLAMSRAEKLAVAYSPILKLLVRILTPLRTVLQWITDLFKKDRQTQKKPLTEDEFRTVVEVGEEEGVLDEEERTMVDGIIRLEEIQASDVMTPRVDLIGIDLDDPPGNRERIARSVTFRYLPVYTGTLDQTEGFLDVPRFLLSLDHNFAAAMIKPPLFVPETAPLDTLLTTFQKEQRRVAFVVDEYGGTAGLITRGDILEEIASDVENEYREEKLTIQKVGENRWLVDGSMSLEDINYELNTTLEAEGADRIAGWANANAERILRTGESVEAQGWRATVRRVRKNRIILVLLQKLQTEEQEQSYGRQ